MGAIDIVYPHEINVVLTDNPFGVKGSVNKNRDGTYTIIINAALNHEQQMEVFRHELKHIQEEDFSKVDVQTIEHDVRTETHVEVAKPVSSGVFEEELRKLQRRRKKIQKELADYEGRAKFIYDNFDTFAAGEYNKLYGDDL